VIHIVSCALCLACVSLSDDHTDQRLLIIILSLWKYVDVSILVNKTVHKIVPYCSLCFMDAAKVCEKHVSAVSI
jgi:hypothetical protein